MVEFQVRARPVIERIGELGIHAGGGLEALERFTRTAELQQQDTYIEISFGEASGIGSNGGLVGLESRAVRSLFGENQAEQVVGPRRRASGLDGMPRIAF